MLENEDLILENITRILNYTILHIFILAVVVVVILVIASKVLMEDFEFVEYLTMCTMILVTSVGLHFLVPLGFLGLIETYDFLVRDDVILIRALMFLTYVLLLFFPILFIIRHSFMFIKPRIYLTITYVFVIATLLVIFAEV